jgi:predicted component of type VI protein secretion system
MTNLLIRQAIIDSVNNFEPRVVLLDVDCDTNMDLNAVNVTITFKIVNTVTPLVLTIALERTR